MKRRSCWAFIWLVSIDWVRNFDFDMIVNGFGQSQSPGNEQRDYWTSAAADQKGSRNLAGIKSPVVDALVNAVIYAETQEALITACRALDRVLWYGYYFLPERFHGIIFPCAIAAGRS